MPLNKIEPHMLTFEPALKTEIETFNQQLAETDQRIDNVIATAGDGSIPTELLDIRVINGFPYDTAGQAVRAIADGKALGYIPVTGNASKNLFNKDYALLNTYLYDTNGTTGTFANYFVSDFIPILPNDNYYLRGLHGDRRWSLYDNAKSFLKSGVATNAILTPATATYIRVGSGMSDLTTMQLEKGTAFSGYVSYGAKLPSSKLEPINGEKVDTATLPANKLVDYVHGKNYFNKDTVTSGVYVKSADGTTASNATYFTSEFIEVTAGQQMTRTVVDQLAFYTADKGYISGLGYGVPLDFVVPVGAKYIRICAPLTAINTYQLEKGAVITDYESYGYKLKYLKTTDASTPSQNPFKTIQSIFGKITDNDGVQVKLIGDSITAGVGGTGYATDGEQLIYTSGSWKYANTNGYCWANLLRNYLQSKFTCTVKNWGVSGINSGTIVSNLSTLIQADDDIVICMIGTNNRGITASTTTALYNDLVAIKNYVEAQGKQIIFMSNIPASVSNEVAVSQNFHMEDVDATVFKLAYKNNIEYISLYKQFLNYCELKGVTVDSLLADGLHPNDAGYKVMFNLVSNSLGIGRKREGATW